MVPAPYDTDPDTLERLSALYAQMTPAEKLERVREITLAVNRIALEGLRDRHPHETERNLLLRLARRRLGGEVVDRAFGSVPEPHDP